MGESRLAALAAMLVVVVALVMAGCGGGQETVESTGHTSCEETSATWSGPELASDVPGTSLDMTYDCDYALSDERVTGAGPVVVRINMSLNGDTRVGQVSGTSVISNEGGTWEGSLSGTTTWSPAYPHHVHALDAEYVGAGDYEGLRLLIHNEGTDSSRFTTTARIEPAE